MVWDLVRYPAGDAQAQVFWRRRMAVLAVAALVLLLLAVMLLRGGGPDSVTPAAAERPVAGGADAAALPPSAAPPAPAASAASASASPPSPTASPTPIDRSTTCEPGSMALRVTSDATSYPAGVQPTLTLSLVDVGTKPCFVDLGPTATSITVLSAGKPAWTSSNCTDKPARPVNLTPSAAQELKLGWDRTTNTGGCSSVKALPPGQYELLASVGHAVVYGGAFSLA
jgi:hypothetical protein